MDFRIEAGLRDDHRDEAARLYWQAFGEKLGKLLGPRERAEAFFAETANPEGVLTAIDTSVDEGSLLGLAAFSYGEHGFSRAGIGDVFRHYGAGSLWRVPVLAVLERKAPEDTLQMDGICVGEKARGRGVGTALLQAMADKARALGKTKVTLDVIDRNHRAKALYERVGFVGVAEEETGPLEGLLGFRTATRMVWEVPVG